MGRTGKPAIIYPLVGNVGQVKQAIHLLPLPAHEARAARVLARTQRAAQEHAAILLLRPLPSAGAAWLGECPWGQGFPAWSLFIQTPGELESLARQTHPLCAAQTTKCHPHSHPHQHIIRLSFCSLFVQKHHVWICIRTQFTVD